MRYPLLFASIILATGCVSTYTQNVVTPQVAKLQNGVSIVVATPSDGSYEGKHYPGSGNAVAVGVRSAFERHSDSVSLSAECKDIDCLRAKGPATAGYLIVPAILHWEDRNTEWSGKKDKIEIKIAIYDAKDGRILSSTIMSGKSKWATFGGDHPQDLLAEPLSKYVESLY